MTVFLSISVAVFTSELGNLVIFTFWLLFDYFVSVLF